MDQTTSFRECHIGDPTLSKVGTDSQPTVLYIFGSILETIADRSQVSERVATRLYWIEPKHKLRGKIHS